MREIIVRYNDGNDHMAVRGGEYVRDLVRCKDCKWCLVEDGGCERIGMVLFADEMENHFCGYGEVRDE